MVALSIHVKKNWKLSLALNVAAGFLCAPLQGYAAAQDFPFPLEINEKLPLQEPIIYFRVRSPAEKDLKSYSAEVVRLALEKSKKEFGPYQYRALQEEEQLRAVRLLIAHSNINVIIEMSYDPVLYSAEDLTYIPFPVELGFMSYRACFINPKIKHDVNKVSSLAGLSPYVFGHGVGWTDTKIMRSAGLNVFEQSSIEGLYRMVASGRIDFFCRSIAEVVREMRSHSNVASLMIDDRFLLNYNMPRFFFVNKKNTALRKRLEAGLLASYKDGSLLALWRKNYQPAINAMRVNQRLVFRIDNPVPAEIDDSYKSFYYDFAAPQ